MRTFMRSLLCYSFILLFTSSLYAQDFTPFAFPFIGKWQPAEDPLHIDEFGFQDIQNLRKDGKRLRMVGGDTKVNSGTSLDPTFYFVKNAFQLIKDNPYPESHILVLATDTGKTGTSTFLNETPINEQGDFSGVSVFEDSEGAGLGRYSKAPQGNVVYTNQIENYIWGGDEISPIFFITSPSAVTNAITQPLDFSDNINNKLKGVGNTVTIGGGNGSNVVLSLHLNGADGATTFPDSNSGSTTIHTFSASNDAQVDVDQKKFGTGSLFLSSSAVDDIVESDSVDWHFADGVTGGATVFTIDFWVRPLSLSQSAGLFQQFESATDNMRSWITADSTVTFAIVTGGVTSVIIESSSTLTAGLWQHVSINRGWNNNLNTWAMTFDGVAVGTGTTSYTPVDFSGSFQIGTVAPYSLDGWIDEFNISKGKVRWISDFTPPVKAYQPSRLDWIIGTNVRISGASLYLEEFNTESNQMVTVNEWNGSSWSGLIISGTTENSQGLTLESKISWRSTVDTSKPKYLYGNFLYWYAFNLTSGEATIYNVTVDAPIQTLIDLWDGDLRRPLQFQVSRSGKFTDWTDEIWTDSSSQFPVGAEMGGIGANDETIAIFDERITALKFVMVFGNILSIPAGVSIYTWDGSEDALAGNIYDSTVSGTTPLAITGVVSWQAPESTQEFKQNLFGVLGYAYKIIWNGTLGSVGDEDGTVIDRVYGITAQKEIGPYDFPLSFQNRSLLCRKNECIYSAENNPYIWNGADTGIRYFGDLSDLKSGGVVYNVFRNTAVEQAILHKENETYRLFGEGPDDWVIQRISPNIGNPASLSVDTCEEVIINDFPRQVVVWQDSKGVMVTDGSTPITISEDIRNYWDKKSDQAIPEDWIDDSVGWCNPNLGTYTILIASGSGATNLNTELEYSFKYEEWTKINRGDHPLQFGFMTQDIYGNSYPYGLADDGFMYQLESGVSFSGNSIFQFVHTKDLMLDPEVPSLKHTAIKYFRLITTEKATVSGETIYIVHYADGTKTVSGVSNQKIKGDAVYGTTTQDVVLGPALKHSFKIGADTSEVTDGLELLGLMGYFDSYDVIFE